VPAMGNYLEGAFSHNNGSNLRINSNIFEQSQCALVIYALTRCIFDVRERIKR
jgi:hypothetical protein